MSLISWVRDVFDSNTEEDQRKRLEQGQPRYYQDQQAQIKRQQEAPRIADQQRKQAVDNRVTQLQRFSKTLPQNDSRRDVISKDILGLLSGRDTPTASERMTEFNPNMNSRSGIRQITNPALGTASNLLLKTPSNIASLAGGAIEQLTPFNSVGQGIQRYGDTSAKGLDQLNAMGQFSPQARDGENKLVTNLSSGAGSLATAYGLAATGQLGTAAGLFGTSAGGEQFRAAKDSGASTGRALATGVTAGTVEGGLELLPFMGGVRGVVKQGLKEGGQEFTQSLSQEIIADLGYKDVDYSDAILGALEEGAYGAILGGVAGATFDSGRFAQDLVKRGVPQQAAKKAASRAGTLMDNPQVQELITKRGTLQKQWDQASGNTRKQIEKAIASVNDEIRSIKQGGYAMNPFERKDTPAEGLSKDQSEFINDYAEMIENVDSGSGVSINQDGTRSSSNSPFYRKVFAEQGRPPTKEQWFNEARRQVESGEAAFGASEDYKKLPTPKQSEPTTTPNQSVEQLQESTATTAPLSERGLQTSPASQPGLPNNQLNQRTPTQLESPSQPPFVNNQTNRVEPTSRTERQVPQQQQESRSQAIPVRRSSEEVPFNNTIAQQQVNNDIAEAISVDQLDDLDIEDVSFNAVAASPNSRSGKALAEAMKTDKTVTEAAQKATQDGSELHYYASKDANGRTVGIQPFHPTRHRIEAGFVVDSNNNVLGNHIKVDDTGIQVNVGGEMANLDSVIGNPLDWAGTYKMRSTMGRNIYDLAPNRVTAQKTYRYLVTHKTKADGEFKRELAEALKSNRQAEKTLLKSKPRKVKDSDYLSDAMDYAEGNMTSAELKTRYGDSAKQIESSMRDLQSKYDSFLERVNEVFIRFGEAPVERRKDYITHISELASKPSFAGELFGQLQNSMLGEGQQTTRSAVPANIAGRTENFKPNKRWNRFFQPRKGDPNYQKNPFKAFDAYAMPTLYNIHMTESAIRARSVESAFRTAQEIAELKEQQVGQTIAKDLTEKYRGSNDKITNMFAEYANALTGKTSRLDRTIIDSSDAAAMGLRGWQELQRVGGRATIVGNAQSVLSQTLGIPMSIADAGPINFSKGLAAYVGGDKSIDSSPFIKERRIQIRSPYRGKLDKTMDIGGNPLRLMELEVVELTWHSQHQKALKSGLKGTDAILEADRTTERIVAGRGIADKPEIYRSTATNGLLQYTLEVNAQDQKFWRDLSPKQKGTFLVSATAMNTLMGAITGFTPLPDFLKATLDTITDFGDDEEEKPEEERRSGAEKAVSGGQRMLGEWADMNPLVSASANILPQNLRRTVFGEDSNLGRFEGTSAPVQVVKNAIDSATSAAQGEFTNARDSLLRTLPMGNQARKTITGAETLNRGYGVDKGGGATYPAPNNVLGTLKTLFFGPASTSEARDYYESNSRGLGDKKTDLIASLPKDQRGEVLKEMRGTSGDTPTGTLGKARDRYMNAVTDPMDFSQRTGALRDTAQLMNKTLEDVRSEFNLPDSVTSYERAEAHISNNYDDFLEAYNLKPDEPKQGTGQFSSLIEKNTASEAITKAKALYKGQDSYSDIPDWVKDRYYKEAGVTPNQIELDIAAGFKVADKASFIASELQKLKPDERLAQLDEWSKPTITGQYFASFGVIDELEDMGLISDGEARALKSSGSSGRSGGRSRKADISPILAAMREGAAIKAPTTPEAPSFKSAQPTQARLKQFALGQTKTARKGTVTKGRRYA